MMKGLTLQELAAKIQGDRSAKKDFVADTRQMKFVLPERPVMVADRPLIVPELKVADQGTFPIQALAHRQIAERINIPGMYYNKMLNDPDREVQNLLVHNVNTWFNRKPERRMVRVLHDRTRAFLSDRYQRIENFEVATAVLKVLADMPGIEIVSAEATENRLYIHFVCTRIEGEVKVGDVVQVGGIASNSEVGLGAVAVEGLMWRLRCLNGMKTAEAFRRHHVGRRIEETGNITWAEDTLRADDATVLLKVRDMVRNVLDESKFRANLAKLTDLTEVKVSGNPAKAIEVLADKLDLSEGEQGGILQSLIEGADLSAWGLLNAVTAQAHKARDYDRAVEFEAAGGKLLALPKSEWKEVLEAGELKQAA